MDGKNLPGIQYIKQLVKEFIARPIVKVIFFAICIIAITLVFSSSSPSEWLSSLLLAIGSTFLAAAIVGFILSDQSYIDLLRKHVIEVLFTPELYKDTDALIKRWRAITEHLLKKVLPYSYEDVAQELQNQYLTNERDFHYEDATITWDITVDPHRQMAQCHQVIDMTLVISPHCSEPIIEQYIKTQDDGSIDINELEINSKPIDISINCKEDANHPKTKIIKYCIKNAEIKTHATGERYVIYRRICKFQQNLPNEPFLATNIQRFTKGLVVKARISNGYKLYFKRFGIKGQVDHVGEVTSDGYTRWILAETGNLLLPGESYIIIILKLTE